MRPTSRTLRQRLLLSLGVAPCGALLLLLFAHVAWTRRRSAEPVPLPSLGGDLRWLDLTAITRVGPPRGVAIRLQGPGDFVPHHYTRLEMAQPLSIDDWGEHLKAQLVFNAGQFDDHGAHLGWLRAHGDWLATRRAEGWKAILASGPYRDDYWARVVDLDRMDPGEVPKRYRHLVQSMMLLDEDGHIRVRDTDQAASRTVVGEDQAGRLVLVVTEGAVTLGDLARWLADSDLALVRAMNLDGGQTAQLRLVTPEFSLRIHGRSGDPWWWTLPSRTRLPAVVAYRPQ